MKRICIAYLVLFSIIGKSQTFIPHFYPKEYFINPLDLPMLLAGNFGECRPDHYHSGIDIKTLGQENQPVHAAADGYISRIKMEKGGYGHAIYITHPNGYTTLYAHLNNFMPELQKHVKTKQYEKERWDIDLTFASNEFPVKKGQLIAWSGNTGGSTAPHLHFEIRNTQSEHPLNPELFGFPIVDNIPILPTEIAIYSGNFYQNKPKIIPVIKTGDNYSLLPVANNEYTFLKDTLILKCTDKFGIGINMDDYMDGSTNTLAAYNVQLYLDDTLQSELTLDDIGYEYTRYVNAFSDYKTKFINNKTFQLLFKLPGNKLNTIYNHLNSRDGKLQILDKKTHHIFIKAIDDKENKTIIDCYIKILPEDENNFSNCELFKFNKINNFNENHISFSLDNNTLYDDICFTFESYPLKNTLSPAYRLAEAYIPIHHYFELKIKPEKEIPLQLKNKIYLKYSNGKTIEGRLAIYMEDDWYMAKVRAFGTYWLAIDTFPPTIKSFQKDATNLSVAKQIVFEVKDNETSINHFKGLLDGKWICFEQHENLFFYNFDEHCSKGNHQLLFMAEDENGNKNSIKLSFTR